MHRAFCYAFSTAIAERIVRDRDTVDKLDGKLVTAALAFAAFNTSAAACFDYHGLVFIAVRTESYGAFP